MSICYPSRKVGIGGEGGLAKNTFSDEVSHLETNGRLDHSVESSTCRGSGWFDLCMLALICALFLTFRVPLMVRQAGGMDEGDFSVPGCTILQEGIPRIPYVPSRNVDGFFYRVDEIFLLLPPLYYYWQALFYSVLPPGYGTARLASGTAAIIAVVLIYVLGRQLTGNRAAALWGAGLYSLSRVCFFPALAARPDMLCGMLGLAAVAAWLRWRQGGRIGWLIAASALLGLGGLTHPLAITYAIPIGIWALLVPDRPLRRLGYVSILIGGAVLVFSLWLVLIIPHYDVFRLQFFNNVLDRSGPGLLDRFIFPWESIRWQTRQILEHAGPIQTTLMFGSLLATTVMAIRSRNPGVLKLVALAWSSVYLLVVFEGVHPTKGYWCYPGAWLFLCAGWCVASIGSAWHNLCARAKVPLLASRAVAGTAAAGVLLLMLPGSGIQAWIAHVQHWDDPSYDARKFTRLLLDEVPADARVVVDGAYVLPFYLDRRTVILAGSYDLRVPDDYLPYDYFVAGRESIAKGFPEKLGGRFVKSLGNRDDLFSCYAELYVSERVGRPELTL